MLTLLEKQIEQLQHDVKERLKRKAALEDELKDIDEKNHETVRTIDAIRTTIEQIQKNKETTGPEETPPKKPRKTRETGAIARVMNELIPLLAKEKAILLKDIEKRCNTSGGSAWQASNRLIKIYPNEYRWYIDIERRFKPKGITTIKEEPK